MHLNCVAHRAGLKCGLCLQLAWWALRATGRGRGGRTRPSSPASRCSRPTGTRARPPPGRAGPPPTCSWPTPRCTTAARWSSGRPSTVSLACFPCSEFGTASSERVKVLRLDWGDKRCFGTSTGATKNYTTADYNALFQDANLTLAQELAPALIGNLSVKTTTPGTHFYGYYGSGTQ